MPKTLSEKIPILYLDLNASRSDYKTSLENASISFEKSPQNFEDESKKGPSELLERTHNLSSIGSKTSTAQDAVVCFNAHFGKF